MSKSEFSAVAWTTPVRPLVGKAEHCVRGGETPTEQIRAPSYAWWRQQGRTACAVVALMREDVAAGTVRFLGHCADVHPTVSGYGEDRVRWIEGPEALGLRLVGLAHDVCSGITHRGWFLHPEGYPGEVVCGFVYQMSGRDGRARYLAGYADAWNCDGSGPVLVCLDPMVGARLDRYGARDYDHVLGSVAHRADRTAARWRRVRHGAARSGPCSGPVATAARDRVCSCARSAHRQGRSGRT